jgi:hypothetical protein
MTYGTYKDQSDIFNLVIPGKILEISSMDAKKFLNN